VSFGESFVKSSLTDASNGQRQDEPASRAKQLPKVQDCGAQEQQQHNDSPRYGRIIVVQPEGILALFLGRRLL
jgi:hypothetical protein